MVDGVNGSSGTDRSVDSASLSEALSREQNTAASAREREIRDQLAANPQAIAALDTLSRNLGCYNLTDQQQVQALDTFAATPNAKPPRCAPNAIPGSMWAVREA